MDPIAVTAGIVQTGLYIDFFYVYFTKCVSQHPSEEHPLIRLLSFLEYYRDRNLSFQHDSVTYMFLCVCLNRLHLRSGYYRRVAEGFWRRRVRAKKRGLDRRLLLFELRCDGLQARLSFRPP